MEVTHHDLSIDLPADWWAEAGMTDFRTAANAYRPLQGGLQISTVSIADIGPVRRQGIFLDGENGEIARDRVLRILRWFRRGAEIEPVEVVDGKSSYGHRFKLTHGAHRLYCSLAAGFTHIPVVKGFDITDPFA